MIYVSIPIHEKLEVVKNQAENFAKFFPEAILVYHVSKQAKFSAEQAFSFMREQGIKNVLINPIQVETQWGGIIRAHLQNIVFILEQGDASKVCFHSSNDMLIKSGVSDFLKDKDYVYHQREIRKPSYWWVGNVAFDDYRLTDWLAIHGGGKLIASQIEGSVYHIDFLKEFSDELLKYHPVLDSVLFYPREELLLSSFAIAKGLRSQGLPYILSEVHRFDKVLWTYFDKYDFLFNDRYLIGRKLKKQLNDRLFQSGFYKISKKDINAIINIDLKYLSKNSSMNDGGNIWQVYNPETLFGVKRVERNLQDPIRQYISGL